MYWINFLHIYQPLDQSDEILKRVVNESYRPLFRGFLSIPGIKININISAALTELLAKKGYGDVIECIRKLAEDGKLEFTESAKYHPLLGKIVAQLGYPLIVLDEISYNGGKIIPPRDRLFHIGYKDRLIVVFRERRVSSYIMSALVRNRREFKEILKGELEKNQYLCTAMDGETFGHHRPGLEKSLFKIISAKKPKQIFFSELEKLFEVTEKVSPIKATWASSAEDIEKKVQFYSWRSPKNGVHQLQWRFLDYVLRLAKKRRLSKEARKKLDKALASDQFFWASGEPWWSIEMIEKGAWMILSTLKSFPRLTGQEIQTGEKYYRDILSIAFWWQRSGKIEEMAKKYREVIKIPFKEKTLEAGKPEVYFTFVKMMTKKMREAAKNKNFERAILWRDAIWKLETKNDIYDAIHAVDLLRLEVPDEKLRKMMDKYKEKYKQIQPGQPEIRRI